MSFSHRVIGKRAHAVSHAKKQLKAQKAPEAVISAAATLASAFPADQGVQIDTNGHIGDDGVGSVNVTVVSQPVVDAPAEDPPAADGAAAAT
jgi:hypothetical protein